MQVLVVHAHPDPDSYGSALRDAVLRGLRSAGHDIDLIDLYAQDYDAVLSGSEHRDYLDLAADHPDPLVKHHIDLVLAAEAIVAVYPTFWSGMPAILKGWLERTMLPGVAFDLGADKRWITGSLTNVRRLVGVTTYGSPRRYRILVGDAGRRTLLRCVRLTCGLRCRSTWLSLDSLDGRSDHDRSAFLDEVEHELAGL